MWNPLSWVMEGAALVAIALSNGESRPPDWEDFVGIILLLFINSTIGFVEERNAGNAVKALMESLAPKARVKRGGAWKEIEVSVAVFATLSFPLLTTCIPSSNSLPSSSQEISLPSSTVMSAHLIADWLTLLTFRKSSPCLPVHIFSSLIVFPASTAWIRPP